MERPSAVSLIRLTTLSPHDDLTSVKIDSCGSDALQMASNTCDWNSDSSTNSCALISRPGGGLKLALALLRKK